MQNYDGVYLLLLVCF